MRNYWMLGIVITLGAVGIAYGWTDQQTVSEHPSSGPAIHSITIHEEVDFKASPQRLYEALLDNKQFSAFSGRQAEINREVGGAFSLFNGHIVGRNLECGPESKDCSGLARCDLARRGLLHREIRAKTERIWNTLGLRPHRLPRGLTRPSCRGLGVQLLGATQEILSLMCKWDVQRVNSPEMNRWVAKTCAGCMSSKSVASQELFH